MRILIIKKMYLVFLRGLCTLPSIEDVVPNIQTYLG